MRFPSCSSNSMNLRTASDERMRSQHVISSSISSSIESAYKYLYISHNIYPCVENPRVSTHTYKYPITSIDAYKYLQQVVGIWMSFERHVNRHCDLRVNAASSKTKMHRVTLFTAGIVCWLHRSPYGHQAITFVAAAIIFVICLPMSSRMYSRQPLLQSLVGTAFAAVAGGNGICCSR